MILFKLFNEKISLQTKLLSYSEDKLKKYYNLNNVIYLIKINLFFTCKWIERNLITAQKKNQLKKDKSKFS